MVKRQLKKYMNNFPEFNDSAIIGLGGGSSTGKTSILTKLVKKIVRQQGYEVVIIHGDDFMLGKDFLEQYQDEQAKRLRWDDPRNFDLPLVKEMLEKIKANKFPIAIPTFDYVQVRRSQKQQVVKQPKKPTIFVLESIYALADVLYPYLDYSFYIEASFLFRLTVRVLRNVSKFKMKPIKALKQFIYQVETAHREYVEPQKAKAKQVIRNVFRQELARQYGQIIQTTPSMRVKIELNSETDGLKLQANENKLVVWCNEKELLIAMKIDKEIYRQLRGQVMS